MLKLCGLKDPTLKILATLKLQSKKMLISWSQIFAMRSWSLVFNLGWSTYINCWLMFAYASTWSHWIYVNLIKVFHWHSIILEQCIQKDPKSPGGRAMSYHSILGELSSQNTYKALSYIQGGIPAAKARIATRICWWFFVVSYHSNH